MVNSAVILNNMYANDFYRNISKTNFLQVAFPPKIQFGIGLYQFDVHRMTPALLIFYLTNQQLDDY